VAKSWLTVISIMTVNDNEEVESILLHLSVYRHPWLLVPLNEG
jgi:hypothetical protein